MNKNTAIFFAGLRKDGGYVFNSRRFIPSHHSAVIGVFFQRHSIPIQKMEVKPEGADVLRSEMVPRETLNRQRIYDSICGSR